MILRSFKLPLAGIALLLAGCSEVRKTVEGAVWVQRDSSIAYLVRFDTVTTFMTGSTRANGPLRLYTTKWTGNDLERGRRLLHIEAGSFCGLMLYRPADSVLAFLVNNGSDCRKEVALVRAGALRAEGFVEWTPRDRENLRPLLLETGRAFDSGLYYEWGSGQSTLLCLEGKGCFPP